MAKTRAKQSQEVTEVGPRFVAYFRFHDRFQHVLAWMERSQRGVTAVHLLRTDDGRVIYEKVPGSSMQYLEATKVKTTPIAFTAYLCRKLLANGGNPGAYGALGVERPELPAVAATAETAVALGELYARAARLLKEPEADLRAKYGKLNPGLQAMNLRNRLRKAGHNV